MRRPAVDDENGVDAVNRRCAVAILSSGEHIAITNWFDADGDDCAAEEAVVAVAGPDKMGGWYTIDLSAFEPTALN